MGLASPRDTIVALASAPGPAPRAIVRLSGGNALALASGVVAPSGALAALRGFRRDAAQLALDGWPPVPVVVYVFLSPRSYTGEDMVELHLPSSPPLVRAALGTLERRGARPALRGEFTRRAFLRGRLDLTQAEAVLALTRAEHAGDVRAAARSLQGGVRGAVDAAKAGLVRAAARIEAAVDVFDDDDGDGDAEASFLALVARDVGEVARALGREIARARRSPARRAPVVVLAGRANAGKSTLLNSLSGREVALVSPVPGTTRDVVEADVVLPGGGRARVQDVFGSKAAQDAVEAAALHRAEEAIETADLVLLVFDASTDDPDNARARARAAGPPFLLVANKWDLRAATAEGPDPDDVVRVSARDGTGLASLGERIARALDAGAPAGDLVATERQLASLSSAQGAALRAGVLLEGNDPLRYELAAVELRDALDSLGDLTGVVVADDILDRLFGDFCVGK